LENRSLLECHSFVDSNGFEEWCAELLANVDKKLEKQKAPAVR